MPAYIPNKVTKEGRITVTEHIVTPGEITDTFARIMRGENPFPFQSNMAHFVSEWRSASRGSWTGATGKEMEGWLRNGFYSEGEPPVINYGTAARKRRRLQFAEEGELQVDLALSGHDYPFLQWEPRERKKGIKIRANTTFVSSTKAKDIAEYLEYVLQVVDSAEMNGFSPEVEMVVETMGGFEGRASESKGMRIVIPLKDALHANDRVAWRAFFSGAGFRMLGFLAFFIGADRQGERMNAGLGRGANQHSGWIIEYDESTGVLEIDPPYSPRNFPADILRREVEKAGIH